MGNPFDAIAIPKGAAPSVAPSANPFDAISVGGGASGGGNNEVASVQGSNDKLLGDIAASNNAGAINAAQGAASHNSGGGWFNDILKAIDLPRAAVVSGVEQAGLGLKSALGNGGPGASLGGWLKGTEDHVTVGHLLNTDAGIHNHLVDSLGGIVGDVALDPLTYVGGAGEVAKAAGIAGHVADAVTATTGAARAAQDAERAAEGVAAARAAGTGLPGALKTLSDAQTAAKAAQDVADAKTVGGTLTADTLNRLSTKGVGALNDAERSALSKLTGKEIGTGVTLRVPGTKLLGNPITAKVVPGAVTDPITTTVKNLASHIGNTKTVQSLEKALVPHGAIKASMRAAALNGDGEKAAALGQVLRHSATATGTARQVMNTFGPQMADALDQIPDEAHHLIPAAMEGSPEAVAAVKDAGGDIGPLQQVYAGLHDEALKHGVQIGSIEDYFPHQLTQAARDAGAAGPTKAKSTFEGAVKRTLTPGAKFLGQTIEDPRVTGESVIEQVNRISNEVHGADAVDLFKSEPREISAQYLRGIAHSIGQHQFLDNLDKAGVTASGDMAMPADEWQSMMHAVSQSLAGGTGAARAHDAADRLAGDDMPLGSTGANALHVAPQHVKDALASLAEEQAAKTPGSKFLGWYDKALNVWKQYALAMPGKAMRHTLAGPAWGTYLANVGSKSLREGFSAWRAFQRAVQANGGDVEKALGSIDPKAAGEIRDAVEHGIFHGHEFRTDQITGPQTRTAKFNAKIHNPLSTKSTYFAKNAEMQRAGQDYWRYAMYHDAAKNGALAPEAAQKVRMMLGDPHNITAAERGTMRRVIPFYTFLRQNAPVELKALLTEPSKFVNAVDAPEQETSQWTPKQGIVPQLFEQTGAVGLPWKIGGNEVYVSPDLPFSRFSEMLSGPNQIESQTSPLIQAAIEATNNVNTYTNTPFSPYGKKMPAADLPSVLGPLLHAIDPGGAYQTKQPSTDYGVTTPAGQWQMTPKLSTILGNFLPMLTQAQGLYTAGNPNTSTRGDTSLLDALEGGLMFRTNDPSQQAGELLRRQAVLKQMVEHLQNEGELPRYIYGFHA